MEKKITTVIFDMDGTILNTLDDLKDAMNYALAQFKMPTRSLDEIRRFVGNGIGYAMKCAAPEGTDEETLKQLTLVFMDYYQVHCLDKTGPYEGIPELMKTLSDLGYKMAIVSNKPDIGVKELNKRFFSDYVPVAIGEKEGIARKPAADMVHAALRELHASVDEAVYVGDSEVDLKTAANSGLPCITVLWGFRDREQLVENGAVTFARTPSEVAEILKSGTVH